MTDKALKQVSDCGGPAKKKINRLHNGNIVLYVKVVRIQSIASATKLNKYWADLGDIFDEKLVTPMYAAEMTVIAMDWA